MERRHALGDPAHPGGLGSQLGKGWVGTEDSQRQRSGLRDGGISSGHNLILCHRLKWALQRRSPPLTRLVALKILLANFAGAGLCIVLAFWGEWFGPKLNYVADRCKQALLHSRGKVRP
jgi:hypothetical protein